MELFNKLGDEIEDRWRAANYNEDSFPELAADLLKQHDLPSKLSAWDAVEWSLKQNELPRQRDVAGNFGDPPLTVYSGPRFHADIYFWFEGTTATHQHGFCGAFQVLLGSSIHSWFEFERRQAVNSFFEIGDITLKRCGLLEKGDVQEIWAGKRYIHSLFHLDHPSATIVVRTDRSPLALPRFAYHRPSLAVDPFFEQETTTKKLQLIAALVRAEHTDADRFTCDLLSSIDLHTTFLILNRLQILFRSNQMDHIFGIETGKGRFDKFLDLAEKTHSPGSVFRPVFERIDMLNEVIRRRGLISDPEQRFFMALLLNLDIREQILGLISQRFPDNDPVEKVLDWIFDLAQTRVAGSEKTNVIGIPDLGDIELYILEQLLRGASDNEAIEKFISENPDANSEAAAGALAKLRAETILRPILSTSEA